MSIEEKLSQSKDLVADSHFGIREVVWMALRPEIEANLPQAIKFLTAWAGHEDENVRRFKTEATRSRGIWGKHFDALKEDPSIALPIPEQLKADKTKYVQESVGNWLNDDGKTQPNFVIELCERWLQEHQ